MYIFDYYVFGREVGAGAQTGPVSSENQPQVQQNSGK